MPRRDHDNGYVCVSIPFFFFHFLFTISSGSFRTLEAGREGGGGWAFLQSQTGTEHGKTKRNDIISCTLGVTFLQQASIHGRGVFQVSSSFCLRLPMIKINELTGSCHRHLFLSPYSVVMSLSRWHIQVAVEWLPVAVGQ